MQYAPPHRRYLYFIIALRTPLLAGKHYFLSAGTEWWEFLSQLGNYPVPKKNTTVGKTVQKDLGKVSFLKWSKLDRGHALPGTNGAISPSPAFQLCCWVSSWRFLYSSTGTALGSPKLGMALTCSELFLQRDCSLRRKGKMKDGKGMESGWTKLVLLLRVRSGNQGLALASGI